MTMYGFAGDGGQESGLEIQCGFPTYCRFESNVNVNVNVHVNVIWVGVAQCGLIPAWILLA